MNMQDNFSLANARLQQAHECLNAAQLLLSANSFKDSANRSYYAILHSMRTILALEGYDSKKHSGIISVFRQKFIKVGRFAPHFSDIIRDPFEIRNLSDYEDFYVASKAEVEAQLLNAKEFFSAVEKYLESQASNTK